MKVTPVEIAEALGVSKQAVNKRAKKEGWLATGDKVRGGGNVYELETLPKAIQLAMHRQQQKATLPAVQELLSEVVEPEALPARPLPALNSREVRDASFKADLLRLYKMAIDAAPWGRKVEARDAFMTSYNSGIPWPNLYKEIGPLSWKTMDGWDRKVKQCGNDHFRLADRRGRHLRGSCSLTAEQTDIVLRCVLRPNKPRISEGIRIAQAVMGQKGIETRHSEATYRRFLQNWKEHNYHVWTFVREGAKAWNDKCAFYIERDLNVIEVGDVVVADGHNLNFEIINPWTGKRQNHMTLILFYDMRSNMPLGWEIMPTENTAAISSALRRAVIRLGKYPRVVYLDNGKAFKSRFFKGSQDFDEAGYGGLYERMGCQTIYAWPYHGQSKPVERFFGSFGELERMNALSYTGTSIADKPPRMLRGEKQHRKLHEQQFGDRCLTLAEAHQIIAAWFDIYATRAQKDGHLKGVKPMDVFVEGRGPGVDRAELTWLMMSLEIKKLHRNGITFQGQNYYHPALYGRKHPVTVRYDLQDTSSLWVFDESGELLCEAMPTSKLHPAAAQLGSEDDKVQLRQHIEYKRQQEKEASASARTLLQNDILPEHDRQMRLIGVGAGEDSAAVKSLPSSKVISFDAEKVAREVAEMETLQKAAEERDFRDGLLKLDEADRYEKLIELSAQGVDLGQEWIGFMTFFETTPEYERHPEYWESCRVKYGLMYRSAALIS